MTPGSNKCVAGVCWAQLADVVEAVTRSYRFCYECNKAEFFLDCSQ